MRRRTFISTIAAMLAAVPLLQKIGDSNEQETPASASAFSCWIRQPGDADWHRLKGKWSHNEASHSFTPDNLAEIKNSGELRIQVRGPYPADLILVSYHGINSGPGTIFDGIHIGGH